MPLFNDEKLKREAAEFTWADAYKTKTEDWDDKLEILLNRKFLNIVIEYKNLSTIISRIGGTQAALYSFFVLMFTGSFRKNYKTKQERYMIA